MIYEKVLIRKDGSKVRINVSFYDSSNEGIYNICVDILAPRKRKWVKTQRDDYEWRSLDREGREKADLLQILEYVSVSEIQEAKIELWEMLKPKYE